VNYLESVLPPDGFPGDWADYEIVDCSIEGAGNTPATSDPSGNRIGIDFGNLAALVPEDTPGAPGLPGLLVVLIYHELVHLIGAHGGDWCGELQGIKAVAQKHCEFICFIQSHGGGPLDALCLLYAQVRKIFNCATTPDGEESKVHAARAGCGMSGSGNDIPPCGCCEGVIDDLGDC
jgi:hypothetical protein